MKTILTSLLLICFLLSNGQIFNKKKLLPGITSIKSKYYSGSGGRGYWSFEKLDSLGRPIEERSYCKKKLLARTWYQYNNNNDLIYEVALYDFNRPNQMDTTKYEYVYTGNRIEFQKRITHYKDSTIHKLVKNERDSIVTYQSISLRYLNDKQVNNKLEYTYILTYQNNLLTKLVFIEPDNNKQITFYEYFENGNLKRRVIQRVPEPSYKIAYAGGPGSDDQSYKYIYNKAGRIKKKFTIVENKTYKLARYRYTNN